jgi:hypothetical protein
MENRNSTEEKDRRRDELSSSADANALTLSKRVPPVAAPQLIPPVFCAKHPSA